MPRTKLTTKYGKARPGVEFDEEAIAKRKADTERFMADPKVQAEMEEGRRALEAEIAAAEAKAKAKPGPKPTVVEGKELATAREARRADLRTEAERQADFERYADLDFPEDDPDVPVQYVTSTAGNTFEAPPAGEDTPAAGEDHTVERRRMPAGYEVLSEPFTGQRRVDPEDPNDPLAIATVETLTYRLAGDLVDYILEQQTPEGRWQEVSRGYEIGSLALHFGFRKIVPAPEFVEFTNKLPVNRPLTTARRLAMMPKDAVKLTPEQRKAHNEQVKEAVIRQRIARAQRDRETGGGETLIFAGGGQDTRP